jgi:hypothetical protein
VLLNAGSATQLWSQLARRSSRLTARRARDLLVAVTGTRQVLAEVCGVSGVDEGGVEFHAEHHVADVRPS